MNLLYGCVIALLFALKIENTVSAGNTKIAEKSATNISWISRADWDARPPLKKVLTTQAASYVVISHTATASCSGLVKCCTMVHAMQNYQMVQYNYDDIGYNFLIGSNQYPIYEGRGWNIQPDNSLNYHNNSFSVALIGSFNMKSPDDIQLESLKELIQYGIGQSKIEKNYTLLGNRQFRATESPGQVLYDIIKKWDHWKYIQ